MYAYVRERLVTSTEWGRVPAIAMAAAVGNSVASITRVPYETAKQRLQTGGTVWGTAAGNTKLSSFVSVQGVGAQMLRDIPYAIITLVVYETLQRQRNARRVSQQHNKKHTAADSKSGSDFVLGGLAGGIGSWLTNPMDVIKTRVQTASTPTTIPVCIQAVWREGGAPAFLRGSIPRLMHKVPANAFFFLFYELFQRLLGVENSTTKMGSVEKKR